MSNRNNSERMGARDGGDSPPPISPAAEAGEAQADPPPRPMSFSTPTEFVELPSKGKFYPEDHLLHNQEHVEISFMTAKEEDILTSKALLRKNLTIDRLVSSLLVDKRIKPEDLLIGDKSAIVIAARITGYGAEYSTRVTCPSCEATSQYDFDLEERSNHTGLVAGEDDIRITENNTFVLEVPRSKAAVEIKFLTGHDEKKIARAQKYRKQNKLPEALATSALSAFIVSVNGNNDPSYITSFIQNVPAADSKYLRTAYKKITPDVDLSHEYSCPDCGFEQPMEVPLSAEFFWPK